MASFDHVTADIAQACYIAAILGCIYLALAVILVMRFAGSREPVSGLHLPVSILKPLHGDEPQLLTRLASLCRQDYAAQVQILLGTQDRDDPAIDTARRIQNAFPDSPVELVIDPRQHGSNRKVSNLANMAPLACHEIVLLADSDVEVPSDYLADVTARLHAPGVGAVTCLYYGVPRAGTWAHMSALATQTHFLPNVLVALSLGLAQPCFGATIALRRETLKRIGGFAAFANSLADDFVMGKEVQKLGLKVVVSPYPVGHVCRHGTLRELMADEIRSARTIRTIAPIGYAGSLITHPLPLALISVALGNGDAWLIGLLGLAGRLVLCRCVERTFDLPPQASRMIFIRDMLSFLVFVSAFCGNAVSWRGHSYRLLRSGILIGKSS